jgi:hypothetical protein
MCAYQSIVFSRCGLIYQILYHHSNSHPCSGVPSHETVYSFSHSVAMFWRVFGFCSHDGGIVVVPAAAAEKVIALLKQYDDKESKMLLIIEKEKSMLKALEIYNRY